MSSSRLYLTLGITIAAVAFGGWRMLLPGGETASSSVSDSVSGILSTTLTAAFTGAEASMDAQRNATGSYAGASVQPPITLVRADVSAYCLQLDNGAVVQHLAGPGGSAQPGPC
jgi:hypothetical protein